jgi:hypothetical protein
MTTSYIMHTMYFSHIQLILRRGNTGMPDQAHMEAMYCVCNVSIELTLT